MEINAFGKRQRGLILFMLCFFALIFVLTWVSILIDGFLSRVLAVNFRTLYRLSIIINYFLMIVFALLLSPIYLLSIGIKQDIFIAISIILVLIGCMLFLYSYLNFTAINSSIQISISINEILQILLFGIGFVFFRVLIHRFRQSHAVIGQGAGR